MKQAELDRARYLFESDLKGQVINDDDLKLMKKIQKRIYKIVLAKKLARPEAMTFSSHKTLQ